MDPKDRPHWVDCLEEKHECFPYGEARTISVDHGGHPIRLLAPDWVEDLTAMWTAEGSGVLTIIGRLNKDWNGKPLGVMLVAKRRDDEAYEVVVWHELYPYALKHLGFVPATTEVRK